jgi:hypothetical protein
MLGENWDWHKAGMFRALREGFNMREIRKWASAVFAVVSIAYLGIIWWGEKNAELVWFALAFGGLFRMIAGTWWKAVGRYGHIALATMATFMFLPFHWLHLLIPVTYFAVKTLEQREETIYQ